MASAESKWDTDYKCKPGKIDKAKIACFIVNDIGDFVKSWYYFFVMPHDNPMTLVLACTLVLPFAYCWLSVKWRHMFCTDETWEKEETMKEIFEAYF
jgi:hypothetical protein